MRFSDPIKISFKNLLAAKFRSFLTILGIIIGVASVILIMAIGQSAQALILDQIKGVGSDLIGILPGASEENGPPAAAMGISITTLKYSDLEALRKKRNVPEVSAVAGYVTGTAEVSSGATSLNLSFVGTTASYLDVENAEISSGRFMTEDEESNLSRVAILGAGAAKDIFEKEDPLNKRIEIKDQSYTVIGVFKERGSSGFGISSQDDSVYIPVKTAQKLILGIDHLGYIRAKVRSQELIPFAISNIKTTLREQHDIKDPSNDDFSVRDQASAVKLISQITDVLRYFLLTIGSISLLVGGIGIMNVMLIAVNQRIREVGLRKAVGAKNSDILTQFVIESASIAFSGGVVGIAIGIFFSLLVSLVATKLGYNWPFLISWQSIVISTFVSIAIGVIFGIYPAKKASQTSPMEALRYE